MNDSLRQSLTTDHEDDVVPVVLWLGIAMAVSMASGLVATEILDQMGYASMTTVKLIGGGEASYVQMKESEYLAGPFVQIPILLLTFGAFCLHDWRACAHE